MRTRLLLPVLLAALALAACDDPNELPDASISNVVDTAVVYAINGTPPAAPAAFSVLDGRAVRLDQGSGFDFAFDITPAGAAALLPLDLLGLDGTSSPPGVILQSVPFEDVTLAVSNGYTRGDTVFVSVGQVYMVRSRLTCSGFGGLPQYGKLEVLEVDQGLRTLTFQFLVNNNCGYRGLAPGIPPS